MLLNYHYVDEDVPRSKILKITLVRLSKSSASTKSTNQNTFIYFPFPQTILAVWMLYQCLEFLKFLKQKRIIMTFCGAVQEKIEILKF